MALGIVVLAACGPPPAPAGSVEAVAAAPFEAPPVFALIGVRDRLGLTSEQISALDSIGRWNAAANDSLLRPFRGRDARTVAAEVPLDTLALLLRRNNQEATGGVETLLTEQQRTRVCEIFPPRQRRTALAGQQRAQQRERAGGIQDARHFVWPWCLPTDAEDAPPQEDAPPPEEAPPPGGA